MIPALFLAMHGALPPPVEDGLQPPMTFDCRIAADGRTLPIKGRISRFYMKVAPGMGLMAIPVGDAYLDHVIVEILPGSLEGLAGRYDIEAKFPLGSDKMVLDLSAPGRTAHTLTVSPVRFGIGYQAFTAMRVERAGQAAAWTGTCTTVLPQPGKKKP